VSVFVRGSDIGSSWLEAYKQLQATGHAVNLAVAIDEPLREDVGVRQAIEKELVRLREKNVSSSFKSPQSMHTVANTIFPVGLYRPEREGAAQRFFENVLRGEEKRSTAKSRQWGTYIGRLVAYPSPTGKATNQLAVILENLNRPLEYKDRYEIPLSVPGEACVTSTADALLHGDGAFDRFRAQGGPCLAHISLTSFDGRLSMTALYRAHAYETRAYGNFLGLGRLLAFFANESDREVGDLLVVASHAWAGSPGRAQLLKLAAEASGAVSDIETHARPLGVGVGDLELPSAGIL
jgi:hypothetical protein